jgi:hypothetical protein
MLKRIPFSAHSEISEQVLSGEDIEGPTTEATQILKKCRRRLKENEGKITVEEMREGFKKWDEKTGASPSSLHLGACTRV